MERRQAAEFVVAEVLERSRRSRGMALCAGAGGRGSVHSIRIQTFLSLERKGR